MPVCWDTDKQGLGQFHFSMCLPILSNISVSSRVDASQTSKMGWSKDTFADPYAPLLPKTVNPICFLPILIRAPCPLTRRLQAILGAHDYKVSEAYDNTWTRVHEIEGTRFIRLSLSS
jgi:hypothetical protein